MRKYLSEWVAGCSPAEDVNPHVFSEVMTFVFDEFERMDNKLDRISERVSNIDRYLDLGI